MSYVLLSHLLTFLVKFNLKHVYLSGDARWRVRFDRFGREKKNYAFTALFCQHYLYINRFIQSSHINLLYYAHDMNNDACETCQVMNEEIDCLKVMNIQIYSL